MEEMLLVTSSKALLLPEVFFAKAEGVHAVHLQLLSELVRRELQRAERLTWHL